jgi:hypothetical protein
MTSLGYGRGGAFTWQLQGDKVGGASEGIWGHRCIQFPTTLAPTTPTIDEGDCRFYIKDLICMPGVDSGGPGLDGLPKYTADGAPLV